MLRTKLVSLVKGEVLSPERIRATTGGIVTPTFRSALTFPKPHFPSKSTISLPPLSKGGGLTAKHKLLPCCFLLAIYPPFYSPNFSAVKTEGLPQLHRPPPSPQPSQKDNNPSPCTTTLASLVKGELLLLSFAQPTIEGLPHRTLSFPQPLQKDNHPSPHVCPFIQYVNHSQVCSPAH